MKKKSEIYQLLLYSEGCTPKLKKFTTVAKAEAFASRFILKHKANDTEQDNWIDLLIQNVTGEIQLYTRGVILE